MKKKILCLAMAAIMAVGIHTTAFAETLQGGSDWKVEFNGSKMSSNSQCDTYRRRTAVAKRYQGSHPSSFTSRTAG